MIRPPKNYLPSASVPWGREVETAYTGIDRDLTRLEGDAEVREIAAGVDLLQSNIDGLYKRQPTIMAPKNNIVLNAPSGGEVFYSWSDWSFVSYRQQTCFLAGNIFMFNKTSDPITAIEINIPGWGRLYQAFAFDDTGDAATATTTFSFNNAVTFGVGSYAFSCKLFSGSIFPYFPRPATSATYNINLGVFPE